MIIVEGQPLANLPEDLYIPPDALEVILETFTGPLDLLLYLIRRQNLDILNIPIATITEQYMQYIDILKDLRLELAGEYLVMAAMLAEIKSRMLLPRRESEEDEEDDPRAELMRRLQEYECYKKAAEDLDQLPRLERDIFIANALTTDLELQKPLPDVDFDALMNAFRDVIQRVENTVAHQIQKETLSIRERMTTILNRLNNHDKFAKFEELFTMDEGRMGVIVSFIAILELVKQSIIECVQVSPYSQIHIKLH